MIRLRDALMMLAAFTAFGLVLTAMLRAMLRPWWNRRGVKAGMAAVVVLDVVVPAVWFLLKRLGQSDLADGLVTVHLGLFCAQVIAAGVIVVVVLLRASGRVRLAGDAPRVVESRRRFLLEGVAVAVPAAAVAAGVGGVVEAEGKVRLRRIPLPVPGLPPALDGLRILQISDVHLWTIVTNDDLDRALDQVPPGSYDLVCATGDIADDMTQLPHGLARIATLDAPLGHFACLGNHEHARGLPEALRAYVDSDVELLRGGGRELVHRGQRFMIGGVDDLRAAPRMAQRDFYPEQLRRAFDGADPGSFQLLMSHRPSVMPFAARAGVDVVLAGHTHGGQLAIGGTSVLELNGATRWAWGVYRERDTVMYVTSGTGQWFPFRLWCPPEMVILELTPATSDETVS